jgi:hypothetical protein
LLQPILSATALSTARCFGCFRHQLAPELERILADRMREFVHEAFKIDRRLITHAALNLGGWDCASNVGSEDWEPKANRSIVALLGLNAAGPCR